MSRLRDGGFMNPWLLALGADLVAAIIGFGALASALILLLPGRRILFTRTLLFVGLRIAAGGCQAGASKPVANLTQRDCMKQASHKQKKR